MVSVLLVKISIMIPEILLCEDSGMAAVLNGWMTVIILNLVELTIHVVLAFLFFSCSVVLI